MDGIINVYKQKGMSSHDVVNKIRRIFNTKQVGHTGTLDPNAEGVLVICLNSATKLVQFLEADTKKYRAELIIGMATDTYDITGKVINKVVNPDISYEKVKEVIKSFLGAQKQKPPLYSAIKVNGKKLYDYALKNQTVEVALRDIFIYDIEVIDDTLIKKEDYYSVTFEVTVSKGTYIRSLCYDIGEKLNIPCTMGDLLRVRSGAFELKDAKTLEQIEQGDFQLKNLVDSLAEMDQIDVLGNVELEYKISNGMKLSLKTFDKKYNRIAFINQNQLLAVYEYHEEENYKYYKAVRVWK